jgi:dynein light chain LC8-type
MEEIKVNVKACDMSEEMQRDAVETAKHVSARTLAAAAALLLPPSACSLPRPRCGSQRPVVPRSAEAPHQPRSLPFPARQPPLRLTAPAPPRPAPPSAQALGKWNVEKDIAAYIKKEFDARHGPTWHCIVGRNFGSYVTHETRHFAYFYVGPQAVLLFKSG